MCGIIAYLGHTDGTESILLGLSLLQNRGYDSVGLSSIINSQLQTIKMASTTTHDAMNLLTNQVHQLIAIWFSQQRNTCVEKRRRIITDLRSLSYHVQYVLQQRVLIREIAESLIKATNLFILGKGSDEAIAKEGSLKIKEIVYVHAEGYSSSALKHGPLALLEESVPVLLLDTKLEFHDKIINAYHEVHARHSRVIIITNREDLDYPDMIRIPKNDTCGGILANIVLQLLAYEWSIHKGYSPDFPRNLAKVVTVE